MGEANCTSHLMQRLSVAMQRGNAAVVLACIPPNLFVCIVMFKNIK